MSVTNLVRPYCRACAVQPSEDATVTSGTSTGTPDLPSRAPVRATLQASPAGVLLWARRIVQAVRRWIATTGVGLNLTAPEDMPEIAEEQVRSLRVTAVALAACGMNGLLFVLCDFGARSGTQGGVLAGVMVLAYAVWIVLAVKGAKADWFVRASVALLSFQGTLWGVFLYHAAEVATARQSNIIVGIAMALVSTPMLASPFVVAVAFWFPVAIGAELALGWGLIPNDPYLAQCFVGYELFTLVGIVFINRTLLQKSIGRVRLDAQNATVSLLLKEYEENAADWLWETDDDMRARRVTQRFAQVLGSTADAIDGQPIADALRLAPGSSDHAHLIGLMRERTAFRDQAVRAFIDSEERWWLLSGRPVSDSKGRPAGYRGVGSDVTEARRADEATLYLATHDTLTGIANRSVFLERMTSACSKAGQPDRHFALLMIDLDRFKEINDDYGHAVGDQILQFVAERLERENAPGQTVARLGGDEFALMLPYGSAEQAGALAATLIGALSEPMRVGDTVLTLGASIGVALFPKDGSTTTELMRNADLALYRSKREGKGMHRLFDPAFGEEFETRMVLLSELKRAVQEGALTVVFQPIIDMANGHVVSMEALCRWNHPARGAISPAVFIPLAEESGLIIELGYHVLSEACRTAASWTGSACVSVNLSPLQLKDTLLCERVATTLAASGLDSSRLELEVTESAWLNGDAQTNEQITRLRGLGVNIVMDDFGTGFSSLSTLHRFDFHGLKIDADFMRNAASDPKAGAIVRLVAKLARELGIKLTAEGIETETQLACVRAWGIPRAQGYLLGRPQPLVTGETPAAMSGVSVRSPSWGERQQMIA